MKAEPNKLISVVWEGVTITQFSDFRSGATVHEQFFFELKFKQPVTGSPFNSGIDDPECFNEKPITLNFQAPSGAAERVIGNIIKVAYVKSPGQQPEIFIGGTMHRPSVKFPKFNLLAIALLMLPILFIGGLLFYASSIQHNLTLLQGKVTFFEENSYKMHKRYTFKVSPYKATLFRDYHRHIFGIASQNITSLFMSDYDGFHADSTGQPVRFYVLKKDSAKLFAPHQKVSFFDIRGVNKLPSRKEHFLDALNYAADNSWLYFVWLLLLATQAACFCGAYYHYKMYSLFHYPGNKVLWWGSLVLSSIINFVIVMTIA
ncbi:hypothetical protein ABDD95_00930 [Mucilaginibacter sp. PAMB04274]|uniref:hypothetical protein n=1 Tax=Mucilaginibacter sp. PAMB04274 TaxID=3138568 RepID=UPI0031F67818